jgi:hypothetical protein
MLPTNLRAKTRHATHSEEGECTADVDCKGRFAPFGRPLMADGRPTPSVGFKASKTALQMAGSGRKRTYNVRSADMLIVFPRRSGEFPSS